MPMMRPRRSSLPERPQPGGCRPAALARVASLAAMAVLLAGAAACGKAPTDLEQAREAADDGDRVRAIGFYQRHLEEAPDDFDSRLEYTLLLGEEWAFSGGDRRPILENLEMLHAADPGNLRVRELLAMMLVREGQAAASARRFEDAESYYLQAIDVQPDVGTASYHLGVLYADWDRPEEAFESWVAAAFKRPPIPDLYLRLGIEYTRRGDLDRAINTLELVEELRGTSTYLIPRAHCALAQAFSRRGDAERVQEHLLDATPDCDPAAIGG